MVDKTHSAFIRHVVDARPTMEETIYDIATGDTWLGYDALENGLVDRIITSDEYIGEKIRNDVKVLRLLRFSKTRFVFGMPPPAGLPTSFRALVETMSEFRTILKKINALLHEVSIDDGSITNLISAKASMPEEICSSVNLS